MPQLLLTVLLIAIGWFFLIRPQQARVREQRAMVADLKVGDRVISAGGIHGVVASVADTTVDLQVAPEVVLTLARAAVVRRLSADGQTHDSDSGTPRNQTSQPPSNGAPQGGIL